ncbi:MAG: glycosyltransferase [Flavobacteriaceae bacterium]|uniref:Glycosyltransferase family 2 protein n=1 Tax=Flavobacterium kayseriense TaxID=2764714 RepID=A0ABR7J7J8_9FLAO|nr:glycosyltransferase [Flavobacterium kayseriense]MBC5841416.1 glycosyltransferase family 2 protein [Flavobacterium kayseriense]MBC5847944.1 glycosyltransferase family 2 protein [Flavobacterium kayseriense]MBX9889597.1 glycosyltransferase [Flavobacteriaceae bacterium]
MKFSLIVCTYLRPEALLRLLLSVQQQTLYPDEILIIDGSTNDATKTVVQQYVFDNLVYYKVLDHERGLTKQRNYGILRVGDAIDVVCFLDDDTVLEANYFEQLILTFENDRSITGVGGVAINENRWKLSKPNKQYNRKKTYQFDGFIYEEGLRNVMRNYLKLQSDLDPGRMPDFSHGKTCGFPLNGKSYEVDLLIGMSMAFRKVVVDSIKFSFYFEGYGLYEDADFSIRALQFGKNVINTKVQLHHYHDAAGRPNQYWYGKMVVRNGWYVWRTKNPKPSVKHKLKWHAITIVLTVIRFTNVITSSSRKEALTEALGRTIGWWSLWISKPK